MRDQLRMAKVLLFSKRWRRTRRINRFPTLVALACAMMFCGIFFSDRLPSQQQALAFAADGPAKVSLYRYYPNCSSARAAGVAPIPAGQPGYREELDRDGDGRACEPYR